MISKLLSTKLYIIIFLFSILFSLYAYSSSLNYYFFQDDFFEINISKAHNLNSYLSLYTFRGDIIAYRPITLQNYFFIAKSLFGLNPVGFRFITFIFFLSNAFLISKLISKFTSSKKVGLLTASFWLTSSIHFLSLSWIAAAYNIIGTFFWLLTALLYINYLQKPRLHIYLLSILSFLATIGSFEFSVTLPVILTIYSLIVLKKKPLDVFKLQIPYFVISAIYLLLRHYLIKIPQIPEYHVALNLDSAKALFWYVLWTVNIPEEFKKQIVNSLILFKERFLIDYWLLVSITTVSAIWIMILGILLPIYNSFKKRADSDWKFIFFCALCFIIAISPVLIIPNHTFAMYLTLSSIGIYMFLSYLLVKNSQILITFLVLSLFISSSFATLRFYKTNHFLINSQKFAENFAIGIKKTYPNLPKNSVVYYPVPEVENRQALLFSNALQAIYDDASLTIYYNKSDLEKNIFPNTNKPIYIYPQ